MGIVAMIVGGILGAMAGEEFGFLVGVVLGGLVHRTLRQARQIAALNQAVAALQAQAAEGILQRQAVDSLQPADTQPLPPAGGAMVPGAVPHAVGATAQGRAPASEVAASITPASRPPMPADAGIAAAASLPGGPGIAVPTSRPPDAAVAAATSRPAGAAGAATPVTTVPAETASERVAAGSEADGTFARAGAPTPPARDMLAPLRRWLFGGNTIVKAGIGILFVGLAFLAKYASEHVDVPVELRLASIGGVAIVLLAVGWRLRLHRPGYAQVMQGGAVAVLYLTLFVAFRFYGLLVVGPVFALMVLVAALSAVLAVLQDARPLALVGAIGGFATPLLVSTGSGDHVALFSYYLVLDLGIAAVAWHKTWRALNLVGFVGTYLIGTAWGVLEYRPDHYASGQAFLIAFFVVFLAILLMPARRLHAAPVGATASGADGWVNGSLLFGLPTISFALQYGLVRDTEYGAALSALAFAAVYVALAVWLRRRDGLRLLFEASVAIGTVFLTLVIPFALDARSTAGAWALEGAGLVWLGLRQSRGIARIAGYALLLLAGFSMLVAHEHHGPPAGFFNAYLFNALMAAAASLAAAYFVHRHGDRTVARFGERAAEPALVGWATLWLVATGIHHIGLFVPAGLEASAWLAFVSGLALAYVALSVRLAWRTIALPAIAHAPLLALHAVMSLALLAEPMRAGGWWAWPLALAVHGVALWRAAPQWPGLARTTSHALGVLVVAAIGALQGRAVTADWGDAHSAWPWLGWLAVPALLLLWLPRPASARRWPVSDAPGAYRSLAAAVLAAGLLLWALLANIGSDGSARPLPHVPLLNPLDIGVAIALLACLAWMRSDGAREVLAGRGKLPLALLSIAGFVWLNAILIRAYHHFGGVPYRVEAWADSLAVQTGITLLWTVTALVLMWWSARRAARLPWMTGAALLAAVVLKLLLVDLSGSGTVARIVSFIGVGVLMLVIGYVAPLPSRETRHAVT